MSTRELQQLDIAHVWHPFTPMREYAREATPVIVAGEGFHLLDTEGRRYLDGSSSLWCNVHGHRVPEIDAALRRQLDHIAHSTLLGLANVPSIELAQRLVEIVPAGLSHVFYSDNGSTAVEAALKIVYQYHRQRPDRAASRSSDANSPDRNLFVRLSGAYHGDTVGAVSVGGIDLFHGAYAPLLFRTLSVPAPVAYRHPAGFTPAAYLEFCEAELARVLEQHQHEIAGFVIEPLVQGAAGVLVHPQGYLKKVRELTRHYDIPLIADEVAVGFGRTGTMFACEQEAVLPDVLCLSKGLTGGYLPLAATLVTDRIYDAFLAEPHEAKTFYHGHTYTGNPLGAAAALASLDLFAKNNVLQQAQQICTFFETRLHHFRNHPHVGDVRHKGTMVGLELVRDRSRDEPYPAADRIGHKMALAARDRGVIVRPIGDVLVLMPAPAMPLENVAQLCDVTAEILDHICGPS